MSYRLEWIAGPAFLGVVLLPLIVPAFAMIGVLIVALAAVAAVVALVGAMLATPYLVVRTLRRRLAERHQSTTASATKHSGLTALAQPTTARS